MSSPDFDRNHVNRNPGNPEEAKDSRIPITIEELTQSARELREMSTRKEGSGDPMGLDRAPQISYGSADEFRYVILDSRDFNREDYTLHNLPRPIREHDRIIPVWVERREINSYRYSDTHVWISLDEDIPRVFQLVNENREPVYGSLTGKEQVIDRPDLLPDILEAVSTPQRKMLFWHG
jgi:hypothetical protein